MSDDAPPTSTNLPATSILGKLAQLPPDAWLDMAQARIYTRLTLKTLRNAIAKGDLKPDGRGKGWLFRKRTLDSWLEERAQRGRS